MDSKERFEKINELFKELMEYVNRGDSIIIVEGKRDLNALVSLGIEKSKILQFSQMPEYILREYLLESNFSIIIDMLDCDETGKKMSEKLEFILGFVKIEKKFKKLTKLLNTAFVENYSKSYNKLKENLIHSFIYI